MDFIFKENFISCYYSNCYCNNSYVSNSFYSNSNINNNYYYNSYCNNCNWKQCFSEMIYIMIRIDCVKEIKNKVIAIKMCLEFVFAVRFRFSNALFLYKLFRFWKFVSSVKFVHEKIIIISLVSVLLTDCFKCINFLRLSFV